MSTGSLELLTSVAWTDKVRFGLTDSPLDLAPSWYRWDARATWTSADNKIVLSAFVNNITNEIGIRNIDKGNESYDYIRSVVPTLPRMSGLEFRYRFGAY